MIVSARAVIPHPHTKGDLNDVLTTEVDLPPSPLGSSSSVVL